MTRQELTYWVALALMPGVRTRRKNDLYAKCYVHSPRLSIVELFERRSLWGELGLSASEQELFKEAHSQLASHSFLVEDLLSQGFDITPVDSPEYPRTLKANLGISAPTVLFSKGNKQLLEEPSVAIVGSRKAGELSLRFTRNIAKRSATEGKTVVSGFAKGVDREALDATLASGGRSIIVLPQGILTFSSGFKAYFRHVAHGRLLVLSAFAPTAPWSVELAMARNPIIYGMASEIYVAETGETGGTWAGAVDGLRKGRAVFVRWPEPGEDNANKLLAQRGARAVGMEGEPVDVPSEELKTKEQREAEDIDRRILSVLKSQERASLRDLRERTGLGWSDAKMKRHLEGMPQVERLKDKSRVFYSLKGRRQSDLFSQAGEPIA
ncbi:MAG: DNA-processing protein DprA [Prevotellaceae bacterium]|nr:DNA-processing protein DprA [Prevotellaceae bacterium]